MNTEDRIQNVSLRSLPVNSTKQKFRNLPRPGGTIRNCRWFPIICLVLLMACGYRMAGKETHVPPGLSSIAIPTLKNKTFEPGIEIQFTQAFLNEFIQDRRVKVVSRAEADAILEGVVTDFSAYGVAYDKSGFVLQYRTSIVVNFTLKDRTGKVLWEERGWTENQWFRASSTGVTNEAARQVAIQRTAGFMAERIRDRFFQNF
jgi:outer membrane lipopolysaccharide assembly protein LptE/RlpB